eukprot:gene26951-32563_t
MGLDTDGYQRVNNFDASLLTKVIDVKFLDVPAVSVAESEDKVPSPVVKPPPSDLLAGKGSPVDDKPISPIAHDKSDSPVPLEAPSAAPEPPPQDAADATPTDESQHDESSKEPEADKENIEGQDFANDDDDEELEGVVGGRQRDQRIEPLVVKLENLPSESVINQSSGVSMAQNSPPGESVEPPLGGNAEPIVAELPNDKPAINVKELIVVQPVVPHDLQIITTYEPVPLVRLPGSVPPTAQRNLPHLPIKETISPVASPRSAIASPRTAPSSPRSSPRASPRRGGLSTPSVTPTTHPFPLFTQYQSTHTLSGLSYVLSEIQTVDSRIVQKVPYKLLPVLTVCAADGHDVLLVCRLTIPEEHEEHEDLYVPLIRNRFILAVMSSEALSLSRPFIDVKLDDHEDLCAVCIGAVMLETLTRVVYVLTTTELRLYGASTGREIAYQNASINSFIKGQKPSGMTVCESGRMIYFVCAGHKVCAFRVIHKFDYSVREVMVKVDNKEERLHEALQSICKSSLLVTSPRQSLSQSLAQPTILFYTEKPLHKTKETSIVVSDILEDIISDVLVECDERHKDLKREEYIKDLFTLPLGYVEPTTWPVQRISVWERKKRARELLEAQEKAELELALFVYENLLDEILTVVFMQDVCQEEVVYAILDMLLDELLWGIADEEFFSPPLLTRGPMSFMVSSHVLKGGIELDGDDDAEGEGGEAEKEKVQAIDEEGDGDSSDDGVFSMVSSPSDKENSQEQNTVGASNNVTVPGMIIPVKAEDDEDDQNAK